MNSPKNGVNTSWRMEQQFVLSRSLRKLFGLVQYDPEGNPLYTIKAQPILSILDVPEKLKRKTN